MSEKEHQTISRRDALLMGAIGLANVATPRIERLFSLFEQKTTTPEAWQVPTINQIRELLTSTTFLNKVKVGQYDSRQYDATFTKQDRIEACGPAVLSMVFRTMGMLKTGMVDQARIGDRVKALKKLTYSFQGKEYPFFQENGTVYPLALEKAFEVFDPFHQLLTTAALYPPLGPDGVGRYWDADHLSEVIDFSNLIFNQGGVMVIFGLNYGREYGKAGHFVMMTDIHQETTQQKVLATLVDTWDYGQVLKDKSLADYWQDNSDHTIKQPIMSMIGVLPALPNKALG